jgi:hypothetical protein
MEWKAQTGKTKKKKKTFLSSNHFKRTFAKASDEYSILQRNFLDKLPVNRLDDYKHFKAKPASKEDKQIEKKINGKVAKPRASVIKKESQETGSVSDEENVKKTISSKKTKRNVVSSDSEEDEQNESVYESAGESDISKSSSIRINEAKEIEAFVLKQAKRPEK